MTPEQRDAYIQSQIDSLPFGPNAKATIRYLMRRDRLDVDEAILALERMAHEHGDLWNRVRRHNFTGVGS